MKLYRTDRGPVVETSAGFVAIGRDWDSLVARDDLVDYLKHAVSRSAPAATLEGRILAPVSRQEVWAAGVTYFRSRVARVDESREAGGDTFYDRVYQAERPELFFKAAAWRVRATGESVRIRSDAAWNVPEPEIALCVNQSGRIFGFTIGNDLSARDIEAENPLYLSQAKIYDGACSLGPAILIADQLPPDTPIELEIFRAGAVVFSGKTTFDRMIRKPALLVEYLFRETSFPVGCILLTGTGIVPGDDFTLDAGDEIRIHVPPIGTLTNQVSS